MATLLPLTHVGFSYDQRKEIKADLLAVIALAWQDITDDNVVDPDCEDQANAIRRLEKLANDIQA